MATNTSAASARILEVLDLAEEEPSVEDLVPYLNDSEPEVRRIALSVLSEAPPSWEEASPLVAAGLLDPDASVRAAAIGHLQELREVLVAGQEFAATLQRAALAPQAATRAAALGALWRHHLATIDVLAAAFADEDAEVRREVVLGMVSLDALAELEHAAGDDEPLVRLTVAHGIVTVGYPTGLPVLMRLTDDVDVRVRAAALGAMAVTGCSPQAAELACAALGDPAWEVRAGACAALSAASGAAAEAALARATHDENLDVRKAAVRALAHSALSNGESREALRRCLADPDADVRAFARMALSAPDADAPPPH